MNQKVWMNLISLFMAGCLLAGCATPVMPALPTTVTETPASSPFARTLPEAPVPGSLVEETEHCTIYYPDGEQTGASFVGIILEDNLERVSTDLGHPPQEKLKIFIYPDLETFHEAIGMPGAPEWVIAAGYVGGIQMVTPRLISGYIVDKTIVHELTHAFQGEINPDAPFWMIEGIAMYEAGQSESVAKIVAQGIEENKIPRLDSLEKFTNEETFAQAGGYEYSFTIVEFAVQAFGKEILAKWVKTPHDYERVFGVNQESFEKQWMDRLLELYSVSNPIQ